MMLQALIQYAERENLGDADFEAVGVRWLIPLGSEGQLAGGPIPLGENSESRKQKPKQLLRPFTSPNELNQGDKSHFLCDTLERTTLFVNDKSGESRRVQHLYFKRLLSEAANACPGETQKLRAVLHFLDDSAALRRLHDQLTDEKAKVTDISTFSVDGVSLLDLEAVKTFWRKRRIAAGGALQKHICLATGQFTETLDTHEKIKGVPGGKQMDRNLIAFNRECPSFESFGLEQAQNAALSASAELKLRSALNHLIEKSHEQKLVFNSTIYLHWTRKPVHPDLIDLLANPNDIDVAELLKSFQSAQPPAEVNANNYYAMSLSGNGARIVVRDWLETTVSDIHRQVGRWFGDLAIVDYYRSPSQPKSAFKIWSLLASLVPEKEQKPDFEKLPPHFPTLLLHAALTGGPVPQPILMTALRREIVDRVSGGGEAGKRKALLPNRFALIKLCLLRSPDRKERHTMSEKLDSESKDIAYLCGQLFAVLGRLQLLALGKVGASIAERTYGGVATRPATTLGPLFTKVPAYLKKANDRFPGAGTNKQKEIENLCQRIQSEGGLPPTLALEEQARFALGYYCQPAAYRARREEAELEEIAGNAETTA